MKNIPAGLSTRYFDALSSHLVRKHRDNGDRAQGLGRRAVAGGLSIRDLVTMHEHAVVELARSNAFSAHRRNSIERAGFFLTQALIPLEAAERAVRSDNQHLQQRNRMLHRHTAALTRANLRLEQDAIAIRQGRIRYRKLFLDSRIMQRKLRQLTRQIISAQEDERKEISRELHDEVVQNLVGINVHLSALGQGASIGLHSLKAKIMRTQRLVEKSVKAVHRFARELRPAVLDDLGLIPALQAFSENLASRKKIRVRIIAFSGVESLSGPRRTVLFRVAQEALTNVARHSEATQARVTLRHIPGAIRMEITDDGKSFEIDKTMATTGRKRLGLIGMKERMEMAGGRLFIESSPGAGTTVRADFPFRSTPPQS